MDAINGDDKINVSPKVESNLNPMAKEWHPLTDRASDEQRSLFMTFSKGYSLTSPEVESYFSRKFGEGSVEHVYMHQVGDEQVMFGVVRFRSSYIPLVVLREKGGNGRRARHYIKRKAVVFKKYVDREFRNQSMGENTSFVYHNIN